MNRSPLARSPFKRKPPKVLTQDEARELFGRNSLEESAKKKRVLFQAERLYAGAFEDLLVQHRVEFWHDEDSLRSRPGYPDYTLFGHGWIAWVELKARSPMTGQRGRVSTEQRRYQRAVEIGGGEWRTFLLPDDWHEVDVWLNGHTGKGIWGWGNGEGAKRIAEAVKKLETR